MTDFIKRWKVELLIAAMLILAIVGKCTNDAKVEALAQELAEEIEARSDEVKGLREDAARIEKSLTDSVRQYQERQVLIDETWSQARETIDATYDRRVTAVLAQDSTQVCEDLEAILR